jgi:hypothetical protein
LGDVLQGQSIVNKQNVVLYCCTLLY